LSTITSVTSTFIDTTTEINDSTQTTENKIETTAIHEFTTDLESNQPTTSRLQTTTPIPVHLVDLDTFLITQIAVDILK